MRRYWQSDLVRERRMAKFMENVVVETDGCWTWSGHLHRDGYPTPGRVKIALLLWRGIIKGDSHAHHRCLNRACVNPWHFEMMGTHAEHMAEHARIRREGSLSP